MGSVVVPLSLISYGWRLGRFLSFPSACVAPNSTSESITLFVEQYVVNSGNCIRIQSQQLEEHKIIKMYVKPFCHISAQNTFVRSRHPGLHIRPCLKSDVDPPLPAATCFESPSNLSIIMQGNTQNIKACSDIGDTQKFL